jgi:5'-phosphate synthase pdxT subunit
MEPLREFVKTKAVWGTCAGAILLSQAVSNPKKGGQELLGGVSVTIMRNGWGSQVTSSLPPPRPFVGRNEDTVLIFTRTRTHTG